MPVLEMDAGRTSKDESEGDKSVFDVMRDRHSSRAFRSDPVPEELLHRVLDAARFAPSRANAQPWRVDVVTGATLERYKAAMLASYDAKSPNTSDYAQYPDSWREPYLARRRDCGLGLYRTLGVTRDDTAGRERVWTDNYRCFGAPVVLLIWVPRELTPSFWFDCGIFAQNVMLAATAYGLASVPQGALADYADVAHRMFGVGDDFSLICGISMGWEDKSQSVNGYRPSRVPVEAFATWWR